MESVVGVWSRGVFGRVCQATALLTLAGVVAVVAQEALPKFQANDEGANRLCVDIASMDLGSLQEVCKEGFPSIGLCADVTGRWVVDILTCPALKEFVLDRMCRGYRGGYNLTEILLDWNL